MKKNVKEVKKEVKAMTAKQVLTLALRELRKSLNVCLRHNLSSEAIDIVTTANESAATIYRNQILAARFANLTQDELNYIETLIKANKPEEAVEAV